MTELSGVSAANLTNVQNHDTQKEKTTSFGKQLLNIGVSIFNPGTAIAGLITDQEPFDVAKDGAKLAGIGLLGAMFTPIGMGFAINGIKDIVANTAQANEQQRFDSEA